MILMAKYVYTFMSIYSIYSMQDIYIDMDMLKHSVYIKLYIMCK